MEYTLQRKFWQFIGAKLYLRDNTNNLVCFTHMKGWKLREQITGYKSEDMQEAIFFMKARQIIDFAATYDVTDPGTQTKLGAWRRKGLSSSFIRDEWLLLDSNDVEIGQLTEDSVTMGVLRRLSGAIALIFPQKYSLVVNGQTVANYKRSFNLLIVKYTLTFEPNTFDQYDYRLLWAGANLIAIVEATKQ